MDQKVQVQIPETDSDREEDEEDMKIDKKEQDEQPETTLEEDIIQFIANLPKDTTNIDLTHSRIRILPTLDFPNLLELDLRQNLLTEAQITSLPPSLIDLDLYDNRINVSIACLIEVCPTCHLSFNIND
jgi:Leucine-rich repeat (LRR) protein